VAGRVSLRADELDAADPLAHFRDRFEHEPGGPLYVDGNSLGRLPKAARERVGAVLDAWSVRLVRGWDEWIELPERIGDLLAVHVLGARPGEVVACDSTTVNLYKLAAAVLADEAGPLVVLGDDFPTDRYVLQGLAARFGVELRVTDRGGLRDASRDARLTVLSRVDYRSGEVLPLDAARGLVLWDLSHAAGAVEVDLERTGVQLAVG
jgi:kynureninase